MSEGTMFERSFESWQQLWEELKVRQHCRGEGFDVAFNWLSKTSNPYIVETGSWRNDSKIHGRDFGDGASTWLFDWYLRFHGGGGVSIDHNQECTTLCQKYCKVIVPICGNSLSVLPTLTRRADLLYLDSHDLDWHNDIPAAVHHLKELFASCHIVGPNTLVMIDDNQVSGDSVMGKGRLIHELFADMGIKPLYSGYQMAYSGVWSAFARP